LQLQNDVTPALRKFADDVPKILKDARQKLIDAGILEGPKRTPASGFDLNAENTRNRANPYAVGPDFVNPDNINQWAMDRQKAKHRVVYLKVLKVVIMKCYMVQKQWYHYQIIVQFLLVWIAVV
jgi:hypothetical protein